MAIVNHAKKEINAKIIYFGPAGSGKGASLQYIHGRIKPSLKGELKRTAAGGDELLFFDFSPFEAPLKHGYTVRFHLYTLTGQVTNPATWKMVLKGADGIVIQVDAAPQHLLIAREAVSSLRGFLSNYGIGLRDAAVIIQCNSADTTVSALAASAMVVDLDLADFPGLNSVALKGEGVLQTFSTLSRIVLSRIEDTMLRSESSRPATENFASGPVAESPDSGPAVYVGQADMSADLSGHDENTELLLECATPVINGTTIRLPVDISCGKVNRRVIISVSIEAESASCIQHNSMI